MFNIWGNFLDFALYGSWEAVHSLKIMSQGVGTFSTIEHLILRTFIFRHFGDPRSLSPQSATRLAQARSHSFQIKLICIEISARPPEKSIGSCHSEKKCDPACASQVALLKFDPQKTARPGLHKPRSSKIKGSLYMSWRKPGRTQSLPPSLQDSPWSYWK